MPRVHDLILAATRAELVPVATRLSLPGEPRGRGLAWRGSFMDHRVAAAVTGVGPQRAESAAARLIEHYRPHRVLTTGTAGGADPALATGDVLVPAVVVDAETGERFEPTMPGETGGVLWTCAHLVSGPVDKARVFRDHGASAVDMESASVARVCVGRGIPWLCVRAVLDTADEALPAALLGLTREDGRTRIGAAVGYALTHPWRIATLARLGSRTNRAMCNAAERLIPLL